MKRVKIEVTAEDIKRGHRQRLGGSCPIDRALRRAFRVRRVRAIGGEFGIEIGGESYAASPTVERFICDFDAGRPVKPFSFTLRVSEGK